MIARLLLLLIVTYLALRLVGRWRPLKSPPPAGPAVQASRKCPQCGTYVVGASPEPCDRADCSFR